MRRKRTGKKALLEKRFYYNFCRAFPNLPKPMCAFNGRQHCFHPIRQWRSDFAWPSVKIAVEIQGGSFLGKSKYKKRGGHNTAIGQSRDYEKNRAAVMMGWRVLMFNTSDLKKKRTKKLGKRGGSKYAPNYCLMDCVRMTGNFVKRELLKELLK